MCYINIIMKKYTVAGSGENMTIYIGSRLSDIYFRIYNKSLESKSKKSDYTFKENGKEVVVYILSRRPF